jgi:hypothetical protein
MARYRIDEEESAVSITVTEVGSHRAQLMEAFGDCQAGRCSCPTNESIQVEQVGDVIRLRLEPKPGEKFNTSEIAACLDYTTAKASPGKPATLP